MKWLHFDPMQTLQFALCESVCVCIGIIDTSFYVNHPVVVSALTGTALKSARKMAGNSLLLPYGNWLSGLCYADRPLSYQNINNELINLNILAFLINHLKVNLTDTIDTISKLLQPHAVLCKQMAHKYYQKA